MNPLTDRNIELLFRKKTAFVFFTAPWCQPCRQIKQHVFAFAEANPDISWYLCDISTDGGIAAQFSIVAVPSFVSVSYGRVVDVQIAPKLPLLQVMAQRLRIAAG